MHEDQTKDKTTERAQNYIDRGAASITITLDKGIILVKHGDDGTLLAHLNNAPDGTWDKLWDAMEALGIERLYA